MAKIVSQAQLTVDKIYENVIVKLTNEVVAIPSFDNGDLKDPSLSGASTTVEVFRGKEKIPYEKITIGDLVLSKGTRATKSKTTITLQGITEDSGYVDIPVTFGGVFLGSYRFTYVKQRDGISYTIVLTNEAHVIACDSAGTPNTGELGSGGKATCHLVVYKGSKKMVAVAEGATPGLDQFKYKIIPDASVNCTGGRADNDTFHINTVSRDSGSLAIDIVIENRQTIRKVMSFSKAVKGQNGSNGKPGPTGPAGPILDWVNDWNSNKTEVADHRIVSPRIFAGVGGSKPTGVANGKDVFGVNGRDEYANVVGIAGYKLGKKVYHLTGDGDFLIGDKSKGSYLSFDGKSFEVMADQIKFSSSKKTIQETIKEDINKIAIGGRNLLKKSDKRYENSNYNIAVYDFGNRKLEEGEEFTIQIKGKLGSGKKHFGIYNSGGSISPIQLTPSDLKKGIYVKTGKWVVGGTPNNKLYIYVIDSAVSATSLIEWIKLEVGNRATDWTPAPEDLATIENTYSRRDIETKFEKNKESIELGVSQKYETKTSVTEQIKGAKSYADTKKAEAVSAAASDAKAKADAARDEAVKKANQNTSNLVGGVEGKLNAFKGDVYTRKETLRTEDIESRIKASKDSIELGVSSKYETKDTVTTAIREARSYTDTQKAAAVKDANSYADKKKGEAISEAAADAQKKVGAVESNLNAFKGNVYTRSETLKTEQIESKIKASKEEITLGVSKTYETKSNVTTAISDAKKYTDTAKNAAISAAATDAQSKATAAQSAAIAAAASDAQSKVNSAKNDLQGKIDKKANTADVYNRKEVFTQTQTRSEIKAVTDQIKLTVEATQEMGEITTSAKMLYPDTTFMDGWNGIAVYNNANNGAVQLERVSKSSDCPTSSTHMMRIKTTGAADPGHGGFTFNTPSRINAKFILEFVAKIPAGRTISFHTNAIGSGGKQGYKFLTPVEGTGNWERYALRVQCGASGSFSSTMYIALNGGSYPVEWYIAKATVYDVNDTSNIEKRLSKAEIDIKPDKIVQSVSSGITNGGKINVTSLTLDNHGLTVKNGGFKIADSGNRTTFQIDQYGNLTAAAGTCSLTSGGMETKNTRTGEKLILSGNFLDGYDRQGRMIYETGIWTPPNSAPTGYVSVSTTNASVADDKGLLYMCAINDSSTTAARIRYSRDGARISGNLEFYRDGGMGYLAGNGLTDLGQQGYWFHERGYFLTYKGPEYFGKDNQRWPRVYADWYSASRGFYISAREDEDLVAEVPNDGVAKLRSGHTVNKQEFVDYIKNVKIGLYDAQEKEGVVNPKLRDRTVQYSCSPILTSDYSGEQEGASSLIVKDVGNKEGEIERNNIDLMAYNSALTLAVQEAFKEIEALKETIKSLQEQINK